VNREFAPRVLETVRVAARAKKAFWLSHMRRGEPSVRKVGIVADGSASSPNPETRNPKPETRNPKPETQVDMLSDEIERNPRPPTLDPLLA
jgi:hypothetical protein